ncbi:hypothetical protein [Nocardia sp. NPDC049149]|uniref:hypothetical protein n=1 Tax=Nocardia sp. NPDC049149 TaxID=3364315 RepID=UPI003724662C
MSVCSFRDFRKRPADLSDIAAQVGSVEVLYQRIRELRAAGMDYAANTIAHEMLDLGLLDDAHGQGAAILSLPRTAG